MRDDNESLLQRLIAGATNLVTPKSQIRLKCPDCGLDKLQGDPSPCGSHPVLSDPSEDTLLVRIGFVKPKPREKELPPPVERLDGQPTKRLIPKMKQPEERWKKPEGREQETRATPPESRKRTDGGKSRRDYVGLRGNDDPFIQAQESNYYSYEPRHDEPTDIEKHKGRGIPTYSLGDKG